MSRSEMTLAGWARTAPSRATVVSGDEVVVFGKELSVSQLAHWTQTIPYEILTGVSGRVKRVYFEE